MAGPQYTEKDLYYYGAFMGGIIIAFLALGRLGVTNQIVRLVVGLIVGVGLGWAAERAYLKSKQKPGGDTPDKS